MLFRTRCGGHWRFCVVTAFLIVVYISRRGLVLGLGHPRILALDFITQTDGGTVRCRLGIVGVSHRGVRRCLIIRSWPTRACAGQLVTLPGVPGETHRAYTRRLEASCRRLPLARRHHGDHHREPLHALRVRASARPHGAAGLGFKRS